MNNSGEEHIWQFDIANDAQRRDNGRDHFEVRANEMAAELGCHLIGLRNVQLEFIRGRWKVTGTALLEKMKAVG